MTTLTIQVPDSEVLDVSSYIKEEGGKVVEKNLLTTRAVTESLSYTNLTDSEINPMALSHAEGSLKEGWDLSEEENEYWNSFIK